MEKGPWPDGHGVQGESWGQVGWTAGVTAWFAGWDLLLGTGSPAGSPGVGGGGQV